MNAQLGRLGALTSLTRQAASFKSKELQNPQPAGVKTGAELGQISLKKDHSNRIAAWDSNVQHAILDNTDRALAAVQAIQDILSQMQQVASDSETGAYTNAQRAATHTPSFVNLLTQITNLVSNVRNLAGTQILNNAAMGAVVFGRDAVNEVITLPTIDLRTDQPATGGPPLDTPAVAGIGFSAILTVSTVAAATATLGILNTSIARATVAAANIKNFGDALAKKSDELASRKADVDDDITDLTVPNLDVISNALAELSRALQVIYSVIGQENSNSQKEADTASTIL